MKKILVLCLLLAAAQLACSLSARPIPIPTPSNPTLTTVPTQASPAPINTSPSTLPPQPTVPPSFASPEDLVAKAASEAILALRNGDMASLATLVSPSKGLRFTPYAYVSQANLVFTPDKLQNLLADPTTYHWGDFSGSGMPIDLTFADYYKKFVYDQDYAKAPQTSLNHRLGMGNTIDNSAQFYPGTMVAEYYFPGFDPQFNGMDWKSLRLVFVQENNTWYLAAIIHDEWTP
jgi:hypothetical protein